MGRRRRCSGSAQTVILVLVGAFLLYQVLPTGAANFMALATAIGLVAYAARKKPPTDSSATHRTYEAAQSGAEPTSAPTAAVKRPGRSESAGASARWIPAGEAVSVAGTELPGGMLYVGASLPTPSGKVDPSLIVPTLPVSTEGDYTERRFGYWPSYSEISSEARRGYLRWLQGGRRDPAADVGYVFLFFYGLERRAIVDAANDAAVRKEWPVIADELRRLLDIYGGNNSFRGYASSLLDWVSVAAHPEKAYLKPVPTFPKTFELPLYVRLALGQAAIDGAPVPAALALAWAKLEPNTYLRTPAVRCAEEFDRLFLLKYREAHGDGMVLPKNRTKLKLVHQPASAGFRGYKELKLDFEDIPDVTVLTAPLKVLKDVVEATTVALEPFSRYVGKNPDARHALEGLLQLPAALWPVDAQSALQGLKMRMGEGMVSMSFQELLATLDAKTALTRDKTLALARALESMHIGIEPDVLGGAKLPKPDEKVVLFTVPPAEALSRSTPAFQAALLTLQLSSAVATADGDFSAEELSHLRAQVQAWTHLTPNHTRRLLAHLRLLFIAPISLTALKKKLEPLDAAAKQTIAAFMATVAQSDGAVSPAEVKMLEKVYKALGVDSKKVFSDVHAAAAEPPRATAAKVEPEVPTTGFRLDPARIAALQQDTQAVSALLAHIFKDEEQQAAVQRDLEAEAAVAEAEAVPPQEGLLGLDEAHSALARLLLSRPHWSKQELEDAAADLALMAGGALETLNEAAFDKHDVPFTDGEDPVTVNPELLEKIAA
jgi:uncharacterized tellurite resistance protein B-like protein